MKTLKKITKTTEQYEKSGVVFVEDKKRKEISPDILIPSGSTLLNLECSGRVEGAFALGHFANLIGDSHSGKSLLALTMLAECAVLPQFDEYRLIYDDVEAANEFDLEYLFGQWLLDRLELKDKPGERSRFFEDFDDNINTALRGDTSFIYVLDSFDSLTTQYAVEKADKNRRARERDTKQSGSYGDGKAKLASEFFSRTIQPLRDKKSFILIISQTRDNIGFGSMFTPKTRSGGKALKFYSSHEIWLACKGKEKKKGRTVVTDVQAKITKNKLTGHHGEAYFSILFDYGIDDITSCIQFLRDHKYWTGSKKKLNTRGFIDEETTQAELIKLIEEEGLEDKLKKECQHVYNKIIDGLRPKRKSKYGG